MDDSLERLCSEPADQMRGLTLDEVASGDVEESDRVGSAPGVVQPAARANLLQMVVHGKALLEGGNEALKEDLSANIWSKLPDEVMDLVLAWLPLAAFFRLRCVCRKWNYAMFSPSFLAAYSRVPVGTGVYLHVIRKPDGVLTATSHDAAASGGNRWQRLPLDSIPVNAEIHDSARGLLCCERLVNGFQVLSVCNPLIKKWRDLPPVPNLNSWTCVVKMIPDPVNNSYKIVRVGQLVRLLLSVNTPTELCTEVYDSKTDSWTPIEHTPTDELRLIRGCAVCDGAVHCRTSTTRGMTAFDAAHSRWTEIFCSNLDVTCESYLVNCNGRVYNVTQIWNGSQMESIEVWGQKLQDPNDNMVVDVEWEKIDRMPPTLVNQSSATTTRVIHVGVGDHIYSTCLTCDDTKLIIYSLLSRKWQLIDGCPPSHIATFLGGFEFQPRLDAAV